MRALSPIQTATTWVAYSAASSVCGCETTSAEINRHCASGQASSIFGASSQVGVAPEPPAVAAARDKLYTPANPTLNSNAEPLMTEVTRILSAIEEGDPHAAEQLLPLVYDELRHLAPAKLAQEKP